jgi:hypothetical protein
VTRIAAALAVWLCAAIPAFAQDLARLPLVGVLRINTAANNETGATELRDALAALGDIDGKTIRLDFRLAEGDAGRFPELAAALVRDNPAVIVANGPPAVRAAQNATQTIPIVATVDDLVASGFIDSMARPGGNITGVSLLITELDAKRLEVLRATLPAARRIGLLMETGTGPPAVLQPTVDTARALGIELQKLEVSRLADLPSAVASLRAGGAEAVDPVFDSAIFLPQRARHSAPGAQASRHLRVAGDGRRRVSGELRHDLARAPCDHELELGWALRSASSTIGTVLPASCPRSRAGRGLRDAVVLLEVPRAAVLGPASRRRALVASAR